MRPRNISGIRVGCWAAAARMLALLAMSLATTRGIPARADEGPRSPADELATFELADPELVIELVAAEPEIDSPVAICWDADLRMYVAEMSDYPQGPASGSVRRLEDLDGDGRYETATVIAEGLSYPNGVLAVGQGVLVTAAPELLLLLVSDDGGEVLTQVVVLEGFGEGNQQLRANGLTWGLDNWIYGANGRSDGAIFRPEDAPRRATPQRGNDAPGSGRSDSGIGPAEMAPSNAVALRGHDFRFRIGSRPEAVVGASQFGQTRDDWGRRFLSWNTIAVRQALLDATDLQRNPALAGLAVRNIADPLDTGQVFARGPRPQTFNRESTSYYNALAGLTIFRGDALGESYRGNAFVGESLSNLVHRRALEPVGCSFVSRRGEQGREFLASSDGWFHPVYCTTGPDGALYVVDFYRRWVEHPQFVPEAQRDRVTWQEGAGHGRIWRVRRRDWQRPSQAPLSDASNEELAALLGHPNGWMRDTAQRLLVENGAEGSWDTLRLAVAEAPALEAAHALMVLEGSNEIDGDTLLAALARDDPQLRAVALRYVRRAELTDDIKDQVIALADCTEPAVRFEAVRWLRRLNDEASWEAIAKIVTTPVPADEALLVAGCIEPDGAGRLLRLVVRRHRDAWLNPSPGQAELWRRLAAHIAARGSETDIAWCLDQAVAQASAAGATWLTLLAGLADGCAQRRAQSLAARLTARAEGAAGAVHAHQLAARVVAIALDGQSSSESRRLALEVARSLGDEKSAEALRPLLTGDVASALAAHAARTIVVLADVDLCRALCSDWSRYTIATRQALLDNAGLNAAMIAALVEALATGEVAATEIDPVLRERLLQWPDAQLAQRAVAVLRGAAPVDRSAVLARFADALTRPGDPQRGGPLFMQHCASCHSLLGQGARVGPDLASVASRPKDQLLVDLLDPSRQAPPDYVAYTVATDQGQIFTGLLVAESAAAVTLRRGEGLEDTIPRERIELLQATGRSLMPEGFEDRLSVQDVADLLALLAAPDAQWLTP